MSSVDWRGPTTGCSPTPAFCHGCTFIAQVRHSSPSGPRAANCCPARRALLGAPVAGTLPRRLAGCGVNVPEERSRELKRVLAPGSGGSGYLEQHARLHGRGALHGQGQSSVRHTTITVPVMCRVRRYQESGSMQSPARRRVLYSRGVARVSRQPLLGRSPLLRTLYLLASRRRNSLANTGLHASRLKQTAWRSPQQ